MKRIVDGDYTCRPLKLPRAGLAGGEDYFRHYQGLRKGKWTAAEDSYASLIIDHFRRGLLPLSEQEGPTVRMHLGLMLHCDPMRISKRFAGINSIGKQFFAKSRGPIQSALAMKEAKLERELSRKAFLQSLEEVATAVAAKRRRQQTKSPTTPKRTDPATRCRNARATSPMPQVRALLTPPPPLVLGWKQHESSLLTSVDHHLVGPEQKDSFDESLDAIFEPNFDVELATAF